MGIKNFYRYLREYHKNIFVTLKKVDCLAIDTNAIVHNIAHETFTEEALFDLEKYEDMTITNVMKKIEAMIDEYECKLVIVALDGPPPMAKVAQQRVRRAEATPRYVTGWGSSSVSVGTEFMNKLNKKLRKFMKTLSSDKLDIIYSSHRSNGEGEHKIMKYLKEYIKKNKKNSINIKSCLFYSPDSDIVLLSMTLPELDMYVRTDNYEIPLTTSISILKQNLKIDVWDFIIMTLFSGNDFILPTPECDNINGSLPIFIDIYKKLDKPLIKSGKILWKNLKDFIDMCLNFRIAFIDMKDKKYNKYMYGNDKFDFEMFDFEMSGIVKFNHSDVVKFYFRSFYWIIEYYKGNKIDTSFQYPYNIALPFPFLSQYFTSGEFEPLTTEFLTAIEVLSSTLSPLDFYLLPYPARKISLEMEELFAIGEAPKANYFKIRDHWKPYLEKFKDFNKTEEDIES